MRKHTRGGVSLLKNTYKSEAITTKNRQVLNNYYNDFVLPYSQGNISHIFEKIQKNTISSTVNAFSPFLKKQSSIRSLNEIAVSTLMSIQKGVFVQLEKESLDVYLNRQIEDTQKTASANIESKIYIKMAFVPEYLMYIQKYGVPDGGIFDPVLLSSFFSK